ncbi:hypothetical protein DENIT_11514 [Pseudomonas veronii]|nr:hypothetical protein DENIT_11514 [Pseudomonas veronii]
MRGHWPRIPGQGAAAEWRALSRCCGVLANFGKYLFTADYNLLGKIYRLSFTENRAGLSDCSFSFVR